MSSSVHVQSQGTVASERLPRDDHKVSGLHVTALEPGCTVTVIQPNELCTSADAVMLIQVMAGHTPKVQL